MPSRIMIMVNQKTNSASATLDSILPTVLSTSPENGAATDNTTVSITFMSQ